MKTAAEVFQKRINEKQKTGKIEHFLVVLTDFMASHESEKRDRLYVEISTTTYVVVVYTTQLNAYFGRNIYVLFRNKLQLLNF
jgi:hypothetical protein